MPSTGGREKGGGGKGKGSKKDGVGGGLVCAHCKAVGELGAMKCCGRCRRVSYCSVGCQKLHWRTGGHKKVCGKEGGSGARGDAAGASGGGYVPLQNPCPICLDNEDNSGEFSPCPSCGQMYCGKCVESGGMESLTACPTCRVAFAVSEQDMIRRLRCLLERPWGRFTPVAQFSLGVYYKYGNAGVVQDHAEAVRLFRLAADQGLSRAQHILGGCYDDGSGVDQDYAEAVRWYRLAANQGDACAQCRLGVCYDDGIGVDQDHAEAVRWYRLATNQGHADAQYNLGVCYQHGTGVDQDHAEAVRWYQLAANQGYENAQQILSRLEL
jgi:hypothetical protein